MKYIRTEGGRIVDLDRVVYGTKVIHLEKNQLEGDNWAGWYWYSEEYGYELECRDLDIVEQADAIEDLCDCFVVCCKGYNPYTTATIGVFDDIKQVLKDHNIYGAIWTDKGLIYVAKMNESGVLELL